MLLNEFFGKSLSNKSQADRENVGLKAGINDEAMQDGAFKKAGIPKGFIITHINNERVYSVRGAISVLEALSGSIVVEGVMPGGEEKIFAVKLPVKSNERGE
jgi:S1-C subfamily serine protease